VEAAIHLPPVHQSVRVSKTKYRTLDADMARARTILGNPSTDWTPHHLIPFGVVAGLPDNVQEAIGLSGWKMDSAENLIALPANIWTQKQFPQYPMHLNIPPDTFHKRYNAEVAAALALSLGPQQAGKVPNILLPGGGKILSDAAALRQELLRVETFFRTNILTGRYHPRMT
jgi:hypothetical protein